MCSPSSGAAALLGSRRAAERPDQHRGRGPGLGGRRRRRVHGKKAVSGASRGNGLASPLDPHFDIAALQFELGNIFLD